MNLTKLFSKPKIIGLVADANEGKSNTLYFALDELGKKFTFDVWAYGLKVSVDGVQRFDSVKELEQIRDSVIIVDEMFSLFDLDNRKVKKLIEKTLRLVFHNNNVLVLCGLAENFKKFLSAKIDVFIFKKITLSDLINGSRVKNIIMDYTGVERGTAMLDIPIGQALIYDGSHYHTLEVPYLEEYDTKLRNKPILVKRSK